MGCTQLRILLSAYGCYPNRGSEPGAGWAFVKAACEIGPVTLLTLDSNVDTIHGSLGGAGLSNPLVIIPVRLSGLLFRWASHGRFERLIYLWWQVKIRQKTLSLTAASSFDICHHVTFGSDWLYAGASVSNCPFIWGPVGGSTSTPSHLRRYLGRRACVSELIRSLGVHFGKRLFTRRMLDRSSLVIAQNNDVAASLRRVGSSTPIIVRPHVALDLNQIQVLGCGATPVPRRAVFVGRLVAWKGIFLVLDVLVRMPTWSLEFIGDGPERRRLEDRIESLGLSDRVTVYGALERAEALGRLARASALLFPSFHDSAGWVVAEAEALGVPVVCLDIAGPGSLVDRRYSVAVESREVDDTVADLVRGLSSVKPMPRSVKWSEAALVPLLQEVYALASAFPDA